MANPDDGTSTFPSLPDSPRLVDRGRHRPGPTLGRMCLRRARVQTVRFDDASFSSPPAPPDGSLRPPRRRALPRRTPAHHLATGCTARTAAPPDRRGSRGPHLSRLLSSLPRQAVAGAVCRENQLSPAASRDHRGGGMHAARRSRGLADRRSRDPARPEPRRDGRPAEERTLLGNCHRGHESVPPSRITPRGRASAARSPPTLRSSLGASDNHPCRRVNSEDHTRPTGAATSRSFMSSPPSGSRRRCSTRNGCTPRRPRESSVVPEPAGDAHAHFTDREGRQGRALRAEHPDDDISGDDREEGVLVFPAAALELAPVRLVETVGVAVDHDGLTASRDGRRRP